MANLATYTILAVLAGFLPAAEAVQVASRPSCQAGQPCASAGRLSSNILNTRLRREYGQEMVGERVAMYTQEWGDW